MNREIIFRGKRVDNGEWVHGYYVKINTDRSIDVFYDEIFTGEMSSDNNGRVDFKRNIVIGETICQYTGLKDTAGKMIFEGDIVHYKNSIEQAKGIIEWGGCQFYFKWIDITEPNGALYFFQCEKELEIIGNRFDNPELSEVQ